MHARNVIAFFVWAWPSGSPLVSYFMKRHSLALLAGVPRGCFFPSGLARVKHSKGQPDTKSYQSTIPHLQFGQVKGLFE